MEDLDEIKKTVSGKQFFEPIGAEPLPHEMIDLDKMIEETPKIAPLFVRVDKYKEILNQVNQLKITLTNIQNLLAIRREMSRIHLESDEILERSLQRFSDATNMFSREFTLPRGIKHLVRIPEQKVDENISKLGEEIAKLRTELEKIEI